MKTLNDLSSKYWYRFAKVLYVLVLIATVAIIYSVYRAQYDNFFTDAIEPLFWVLFVLEIFKRSIYYTYFGTISPKKSEIDTYISKIKSSIANFKNNTTDIPENTKRFLIDVFNIAQAEIDAVEKKDGKKDYETLFKMNNLVTQASHIYGTSKYDFSIIHVAQVNALYHAQDLGINIDWVSIDL
jgi:hypothetical protein